ncbi:MAG: hypothetical protein L0219_02130 [Phycisphaerales bacterium]|nr:hypothetical protein [Phycisphaerales bacterium]
MQLRLSRNYTDNRTWPRRYLRRLFAAGFLFFLVKGLIWLAIGGLAVIGIL